MGGSGSVTAAGLVFAFTMMSFAVSDRDSPELLSYQARACSSDTLIVRSFLDFSRPSERP